MCRNRAIAVHVCLEIRLQRVERRAFRHFASFRVVFRRGAGRVDKPRRTVGHVRL